MKKVLLLSVLLYSLVISAQETPLYVAAKTGLSIREKPDAGAKVLDKIPYGVKIIVQEAGEEPKKINTEGLSGNWRKVSYNNKTGYIVDSYLFPFPPPKAGIKTMKEYLEQLSPAFGSKLVVKSGNEETGSELHKQLYKNGGEWHEFRGYEYGSDTYFLPDFTIQQGFLLVRLIAEFNEAVGERDEFPTKDKTFKKGEREYSIKIEKEMFGDNFFVKRLSVEFEDGAIYNFEMHQIDNQLVIFYGSGV
jgi:Bacterial SH3 domain